MEFEAVPSEGDHYDYYAFLEGILDHGGQYNDTIMESAMDADMFGGALHPFNGSSDYYPDDYDYGHMLPELTAQDMLPPELPDTVKTLFVIAYVAIMTLAIVGNSVVIIVIGRNQKMRTVTNMFLLSLAISDMLIAVFNMPFQLQFYLHNEWTMGEFLCKFSKYIQGVVIVVSIFTLSAIALDRYYAICHPLRARHVHTIRRAAIILTTLWVASFVIVSPQLIIQRVEPVLVLQPHLDPPIRIAQVCAEYFRDERLAIAYTMVVYFLLYLAPVLTMFLTYGKIAHTLWIRGPIGESTDVQRESKRRLLEKQRIVRMLIVIVIVFAVSWFPFFTCQVYLLFREHTERMRVLAAFLHLLGYSNACVNPALYCFLNDSFQQHFFRTMCCRCFWQRRKRHLANQNSERNGRDSHATTTSYVPSHNSMLHSTV